MKRSLQPYHILLFLVFAPSFLFSMDKETLWSKLNFPGSLAQFQETRSIARQNIPLVEEILFKSDMNGDTSCARSNSLEILQESAEDGLISPGHFFQIVLRLYSNLSGIAHPRRLNRSKKHILGVLGGFGSQKNYPVNQQFVGFSSLSSELFSSTLIKNNGTLNSLQQKISNAQKSLSQKGNNAKQTAINQVQAAINELNAQRGKHVTEDGYSILSTYCQNLINKIRSSN